MRLSLLLIRYMGAFVLSLVTILFREILKGTGSFHVPAYGHAKNNRNTFILRHYSFRILIYTSPPPEYYLQWPHKSTRQHSHVVRLRLFVVASHISSPDILISYFTSPQAFNAISSTCTTNADTEDIMILNIFIIYDITISLRLGTIIIKL